MLKKALSFKVKRDNYCYRENQCIWCALISTIKIRIDFNDGNKNGDAPGPLGDLATWLLGDFFFLLFFFFTFVLTLNPLFSRFPFIFLICTFFFYLLLLFLFLCFYILCFLFRFSFFSFILYCSFFLFSFFLALNVFFSFLVLSFSSIFFFLFSFIIYKMTKKVPKRAPSPAKNEVLDEKPKIVLHMGILVFMG